MATYKQAVARWALGKVPVEGFKAIYELGVTGVEMPSPDEYDAFKEMGFSIVSIVGHKAIPSGFNRLENHSRIVDELGVSLETAKKYDIPNLIVFSGNREGISDEEGAANCITGLNLVKAEAEAAGVTLVMELLNSKVDHADYQCDRTPWGVGVVAAVNSPRVKLLYDIYHMQIMEGDLIRTLRENIEYFGHIHTAGNPGRNDLDENQEIFYAPIARALSELGYGGWVGHEFIPKKDPVVALREAFDVFNV
ncbi:xylose isomerase [bacterium]|nr:MAG: xylose isomerase [bacterium]